MNFPQKILYSLDSNEYIRGIFLVVLIVSSSYFIPKSLLPNVLVNALKKYVLLSFIFTFLLSYLLTKNINVSIFISVLIFGLNYINLQMEHFENTDKDILFINKYNYDLEKTINKKKAIKYPTFKKSKLQNQFKFTKDNLRYLNYDSKKLNKN